MEETSFARNVIMFQAHGTNLCKIKTRKVMHRIWTLISVSLP